MRLTCFHLNNNIKNVNNCTHIIFETAFWKQVVEMSWFSNAQENLKKILIKYPKALVDYNIVIDKTNIILKNINLNVIITIDLNYGSLKLYIYLLMQIQNKFRVETFILSEIAESRYNILIKKFPWICPDVQNYTLIGENAVLTAEDIIDSTCLI